jgi:biotin transporter BioY
MAHHESMLKKKINLICYHAICDVVTIIEALDNHIKTKKKLAYLCTKVLCGHTSQFLMGRMLWIVCLMEIEWSEDMGIWFWADVLFYFSEIVKVIFIAFLRGPIKYSRME